jgi:hypothetical protein
MYVPIEASVGCRGRAGVLAAVAPRAHLQEMPNLVDLFLCHFHLLALALLPSVWGLASDSGIIACLELLW